MTITASHHQGASGGYAEGQPVNGALPATTANQDQFKIVVIMRRHHVRLSGCPQINTPKAH